MAAICPSAEGYPLRDERYCKIEEMSRLHTNYYESRFHRGVQMNADQHAAVEHEATAYLDGKPALQGQHKVTRAQRNAAFWSSSFLTIHGARARVQHGNARQRG